MSFPGKILLLPVWHFNLFHSSPSDIPAQSYSIRWQLCPGSSCAAQSRQIAWKKCKEIISTLAESFPSKNPKDSSVSDWNSSLDSSGLSSIKSSALNFPSEFWSTELCCPQHLGMQNWHQRESCEKFGLFLCWIFFPDSSGAPEHPGCTFIKACAVTLPLKIICDST